MCLSGVDGRGHLEEYARRYARAQAGERDGSMPLKKPDPIEQAVRFFSGARTGDDWVLYPSLMEYLTEERYEDGSPRRTSTITVFAQDGQIKGSLNDRDTDRVAFATAASIEELLGVFEAKLASSSIEWRQPQGKRPAKRK